jgi:hypothetical protein
MFGKGGRRPLQPSHAVPQGLQDPAPRKVHKGGCEPPQPSSPQAPGPGRAICCARTGRKSLPARRTGRSGGRHRPASARPSRSASGSSSKASSRVASFASARAAPPPSAGTARRGSDGAGAVAPLLYSVLAQAPPGSESSSFSSVHAGAPSPIASTILWSRCPFVARSSAAEQIGPDLGVARAALAALDQRRQQKPRPAAVPEGTDRPGIGPCVPMHRLLPRFYAIPELDDPQLRARHGRATGLDRSVTRPACRSQVPNVA